MKLIFNTTCESDFASYPPYAFLNLTPDTIEAIRVRVQRFKAALSEDFSLSTTSYSCIYGSLLVDVTFFEGTNGLDANGDELPEEEAVKYEISEDFPTIDGQQINIAPDTFEVPPLYVEEHEVTQGEVYCDVIFLHITEHYLYFSAIERHAEIEFETVPLYFTDFEKLVSAE